MAAEDTLDAAADAVEECEAEQKMRNETANLIS